MAVFGSQTCSFKQLLEVVVQLAVAGKNQNLLIRSKAVVTRGERPARVIARKSGHTERVTRASFNQRVTLPRGSY